jgi:antitoxin component YwqK of YwqJK toxin-antitoxin module
MKIIITEEQKKKLFIPRKLSGNDSRYTEWNNKQPMVDGVQINQYDSDGNKQGFWDQPYNFTINEKKLTSKGNYTNGKKDGIWIISYPNGNIYLTSKFKDGKRQYGI